MKKLHLCFDLDGTIINSHRSVQTAINLALDDLGIKRNDVSSIGQSLDELFVQLKIEDELILDELKRRFKLNYDDQLCVKVDLYPEVHDTLNELKRRQVKLTLVTNKRRIPTLKILQHFEMTHLFDKILCIDDSNNNSSKIERLKMLKLGNGKDFYVGDLGSDLLASVSSGYKFLFASWGYGDLELKHSTSCTLTTFSDILGIF